jgi:hypothetical protein
MGNNKLKHLELLTHLVTAHITIKKSSKMGVVNTLLK